MGQENVHGLIVAQMGVMIDAHLNCENYRKTVREIPMREDVGVR